MNNYNAFWSRKSSPLQKQRGVIAVIVTVGLVALIGMVGLALDTGHLLLNKTRLQNSVDAAALSGARAMQLSTSTTPYLDGRAAAIATFTANLSAELGSSTPVPEVTFSEDLTPGSFVETPANAPNYIKVEAPVISLSSYLIKVVGFDNKKVNAAAVAGFGYANAAEACGLLPITICNKSDPDVEDPPGYSHGYELFDTTMDPSSFNPESDVITLKHGTSEGTDEDLGTGSFHMLIPPDEDGEYPNSSKNRMRHAFAGGSSCATSDGDEYEIHVNPGGGVGPTAQGINTRFGEYLGVMNQQENQSKYPPDYANNDGISPCLHDQLTDDANVNKDNCLNPVEYLDYYDALGDAASAESGNYQRRMVSIPFANCSVPSTGSNTPSVMIEPDGFGCFLLTEPVIQNASDESSGAIKGVFLAGESCNAATSGVAENGGLTVILLYKNPDGADS